MNEKAKGFRFDNFVTDEKSENEGVWIDYASGFRLKLARIGCPAFKEFMLKRGKPHMRSIEAGVMDDEIAEDMMKDAIAETIIKGWEGLLDGEGKEIPYSKETARELLDVPGDFYDEVFALAKQREHFRVAKTEGTAKN